jgi:hypothetical protein
VYLGVKKKKEKERNALIYYIRGGATGATDSCCNGIDGTTGY